ncbi:RICIN domain-containing protein [Kitasatospora sp. NBC_01266]|uniref:RICIN domain-containing protein n=1 Tax=Kitasatospora sp. NBC_01266 TaxID=2903572 RepID=UPI002E33661A|nr:RICIN domain-containing protein [Kitasatospora sp. NBC_01266]
MGTPFAHADAPSTPTATPSPQPQLTAAAKAVADARAQAKATGQPVPVDALTTEASDTVVDPDGKLATTSYAQPVRVQRGSSWTAIDTTLHANADGTVSPAVTPQSLTLSGGGSGTLATLTTGDGKTLAVGSPFTLPKPTLSGSTATYSGVLGPDVDLQVTAEPDGGWRDVIVVRTATAAADPALTKLHFPLTTTGLQTAQDNAGNLSFTDSSGKVRLHAPTAFQWDSTVAAPAPKAATAPAAAPARVKAQGTEPLDATPAAPVSGPDGPGDSAVVSPITTAASGDGIDLTPDRSTFGHGTGPWFLDPTITADSGTQASVQVQENFPDTKNYNVLSDLGTGYCGYSDCKGYGRYRAYFQLGINSAIYTTPSGAPAAPTVYSSTLYTNVSSQANPKTPTPMGVYSTGTATIDGNTTWNQQPCLSNLSNCGKVADKTITGIGGLTFDVTSTVQQLATSHAGTWTFALIPDDENNLNYRVHFSNNPHVTTTYDITPSTWSPATSPQPGWANPPAGLPANYQCNSGVGNPWDYVGWIGANQNITLSASSWSPAGLGLTTNFHMWDDNNSTWSLNQNSAPGGGWNTGNGALSITAGSLTDGHQYGWTAQSTDGQLTSPNTPWCYFRVDKTPPTVGLTSTDFPPSGTPNPTPKIFAGDPNHPGTFTLTGADPAPAGGNASGVACMRWTSIPTDATVTGWHCGDPSGKSEGIVTGTNGTFTYSPGTWGTNTIWFQAQDNAGNYSQVGAYTFYAPWNSNHTPVFGNVTGDNQPDILTADGSGNLRVMEGNTDPDTVPSAPAAAAPGARDPLYQGTTWANYQITHRASLSKSASNDDVLVHNTTTGSDLAKHLYKAKNDGNGHFDGLPTDISKPTICFNAASTTSVDCGTLNYNSTDWSTTSQILALGTPTGESSAKVTLPDPNNPGQTITKYVISQTSLLTVENGALWLYTPTPGGTLANARKLSNDNMWNGYDLINPGPAAGNNQATLWARNQATGQIRSYAITGGTTPDYSLLADPAKGTLILDGSGTTAANYPQIGSSGDLDGDGLPDLWTIDTKGQFAIWKGTTTSTTPGTNQVTGFLNPLAMGYANATVQIQSNYAPSPCMDADGGPAIGNSIDIWSCWNGINQRFSMAFDGTLQVGGACVTLAGNATGNGTKVVLATCVSATTDAATATAQQWRYDPTTGRITSPATASTGVAARCLEEPGWATANGTLLDVWDCTGGANQSWTLNPQNSG